ncbi:MAG: hypothetical protein IT375_25875 [Polyangiaceae bacterium]|nr:hypothetical protein [Polyangiaceae bacterium]
MASRKKHIGYRLKDWYDGPERGGYGHIINLGGLPRRGKVVIGDGIVLRRASAAQVRSIKALHQHHGMFEPSPRNPFETVFRFTGPWEGGVRGANVADLPRSGWTYYVGEHLGFNPALDLFLESTALTPWPLEEGASVLDENFTNGTGIGFGFSVKTKALDRFAWASSSSEQPFVTLDDAGIQELRATYTAYKNHDNAVVDLHAAVRRYWTLKEVPENSDMHLLGLFGILESLLTHKPDDKDPTDSLTRQIKNKMNLLNTRFKRPLPYSERLGQVDPIKVWGALYGLRSCAAHGTTADFKSGSLRILKSAAAAKELVGLAVVATMRQALEEPALVRDLKGC